MAFFLRILVQRKNMFMKKFSFLTLAFLTCFGAVAQNTDDDKAHKPVRTAMAVQPRLGIKGGVNIANLEMDDDLNTTDFKTNTKTSFHFGLFANIPMGGTLRFQPELVYSGQGAKVTETVPGLSAGKSTYEVDLHYVNVPLMFQMQSPSGFMAELGPEVGFLVNAEQDYDSTQTNPDIKDQMKKTNFGFAGGIGYLSRIGLGVTARYSLGLSNVYNGDEAPAANKTREFSMRTIQVGLVYHFGAAK
jgi:hypothetical protein